MTALAMIQRPQLKTNSTAGLKLQRQMANEDKKPNAPLDMNTSTKQAVESTINKEGESNNDTTKFTPLLPLQNYAIPASPSLLASLNYRQIAAVAVTQELASRTAGYDPALVGRDVLQSILDEIGQQVAGESRAASVAASFATGFVGQSLLNKANPLLSRDAMVGGLKSGGLGAGLSLVIPGPANEKWQVKFSLTLDFNDARTSSGAVGISINLDAFSASSSRKKTVVQPKLTVNTPGDKYEQEADQVAEQVMRITEPQVQRKCACGKSSTEGECSECKKKKQEATGSLQRVASSPVGGIAAPPIVNDVLSSPGSPLPQATRSFMESRIGQDFSHVRVHTDQRATESAAAVQARAYTVGSNIVFGRGESPTRDSRLLAHELTHVIQQRGTQPFPQLIQRQSATDHSLSKIPSEKWSEQTESAYRRSGNTVSANGVRNCRVAHDCNRLLTTREAWDAYRTGRVAANLGEPPELRGSSHTAMAGAAAPIVFGGAASTAARSGATTALERAALRWGTAEILAGGAEGAAATGTAATAATVAVPIAVGAVLVLAVIDLVGYSQFVDALARQGYIVLPDPLGVCIGLCHTAPQQVPQPDWGNFPDQIALDPRAIDDWIRNEPTPGTGTSVAPRVEPLPQSRRRPKNGCMELNPTFTTCNDGFPTVEEAAVDALIDSNHPFDALGECRGFNSFGPGAIEACGGAPGETYHCKVKGSKDEISVFGCMCCDESGQSGMTYRRPHWSVFLGKR